MTYRVTDQALADLDAIRAYIEHEMQNPQAAEVVENYLFEAFERIARNPRMCGGRARPDITAKPIKFLTVRKYMVIYDDRSEPITIIAVAGGRQDLPGILSKDPRYSQTFDDTDE